MNIISNILKQNRKASKEELRTIVKQFVASDFNDAILSQLKESELLRLAAIGIFSHYEYKQFDRNLSIKKITAVLNISESCLRKWFPPNKKPFILIIKSI